MGRSAAGSSDALTVPGFVPLPLTMICAGRPFRVLQWSDTGLLIRAEADAISDEPLAFSMLFPFSGRHCRLALSGTVRARWADRALVSIGFVQISEREKAFLRFLMAAHEEGRLGVADGVLRLARQAAGSISTRSVSQTAPLDGWSGRLP